jgi:hypothetical protein
VTRILCIRGSGRTCRAMLVRTCQMKASMAEEDTKNAIAGRTSEIPHKQRPQIMLQGSRHLPFQYSSWQSLERQL